MIKVLITGGNSGIGRAIAQRYLSEENYKVYVIDRDPINEMDDFRPDDYFQTDITNEKAVALAMEKIGTLDILINNAAIQIAKPLEETEPSDFSKVFNVNVVGTYSIIKQALTIFNSNGGQIINIGSVHGSVPRTYKYAYDASKAALEMLSKELAIALAIKNIRVNLLEIGATNTRMNEADYADKKIVELACNKIPLHHIMEPSEVADAVYSLSTPSFRYMTGSIIVYDGGRSLGVSFNKGEEAPDESVEPKHDLFIAFHGSYSSTGSFTKAKAIKEELETQYGVKDISLFNVGKEFVFGQTPTRSQHSRNFLLVANGSFRIDVQKGTSESEYIKKEIEAFQGDEVLVYCYDGLTPNDVNVISPKINGHVQIQQEMSGFKTCVNQIFKRLVLEKQK